VVKTKVGKPKCEDCGALVSNPISKETRICRECAKSTSHKSNDAKLIQDKPNLVEKIVNIPLDRIRFTEDNPRLSRFTRKLTQQEILPILMDEEEARTLKKQMETDGQQYDEPLVKASGEYYYVLEGNRRTAARKSTLKDIREKKLVGVSIKKASMMRCKIVRKGVTKAEIRKYLASEHISGKREWASASKGFTIFQMIEEDGETYQSVAEVLGTTKKAVEILFKAYKLTVKYCRKYGDKYYHTFSYFEEYFKKPILQQYAENNPDFEEFVISIIHQRKLFNHKQVRLLAEFFDPNNDDDLCKLAIDELNKPKKTILDAYELYVNYSSKGTIDYIKKATKLIDHITIAAMKKTQFKDDIPKAAKKLMKSIQNLLDTHKHLSQKGVSAI